MKEGTELSQTDLYEGQMNFMLRTGPDERVLEIYTEAILEYESKPNSRLKERIQFAKEQIIERMRRS